MNRFIFGKRSLGFLSNPLLHPVIFKISKIALNETIVDFGVIDGARTSEQQLEMYNKRVSELDGIKSKSDHQSNKFSDNKARAIDIIPIINKDKNLDIWDIKNLSVSWHWFEIHRSYVRAVFLYNRKYKENIALEFGFGYNLSGNSRDYPHISFKGI